MSETLNFDGVMSSIWKNVEGIEVAPGIYERELWRGEHDKRAMVYEFKAGAVFPGIDHHDTGPEQIYVISGVFNDGIMNHPEGTFIHQPKGSSHAPNSPEGCVLLVLYPEG